VMIFKILRARLKVPNNLTAYSKVLSANSQLVMKAYMLACILKLIQILYKRRKRALFS
jgi:hypothetical protein